MGSLLGAATVPDGNARRMRMPEGAGREDSCQAWREAIARWRQISILVLPATITGKSGVTENVRGQPTLLVLALGAARAVPRIAHLSISRRLRFVVPLGASIMLHAHRAAGSSE